MAAPTRVQGTLRTRAVNTLSVSIPFVTPPVVGNAIVVPALIYSPSGSVTPPTISCKDNFGNEYVLANVVATSNVGVAIFVCKKIVITGSLVVTITRTVASWFEASAIEVGNLEGNSLIVDQVASRTGSGTTPSTNATPPLNRDDTFVVAAFVLQANQTFISVESVTPSWTQEFENLDWTTTVAGEVDSRSLTSVGGTAQSCNWTHSTAAGFAAVIVAFAVSWMSATLQVTQSAIEVLDVPTLPETRVTQAIVETLSRPIPIVRVTQQAIEVLSDGAGFNDTDLSSARISQVAVEAMFAPPVSIAQLSQAAVEVMFAPASVQPAKLSQVAVEVMYLPGPSGAAGVRIWMGDGGGAIWVD